MPESEDQYLPLMEAAKYLGVSRVKVTQLMRDGVLPYATSPADKRLKLFKKSDLDAFKRRIPKTIMVDTKAEKAS